MAVQKPTIPKGTRDFGPAEVQKRKYILNTIETVFKKYGFMPIETPTMENLSTLEGKYGDEGDKLLFRVIDSGDFIKEIETKSLVKLKDALYDCLYEIAKEIQSNLILPTSEVWKERFKNPEMLLSSYIRIQDSEKEEFAKFIRSQKAYLIESIEKLFSLPIDFQSLSSDDFKFHFDDVIRDRRINKTLSNRFIKDILPRNKFNSKTLIKEVTEKGLRYDLTVPFARYVVMNKNEITFPFKRYQMQPVWRADRPQKGRYREFWQCDADMVGSDSLLNELDLIQIYDEAFRNLRIENYELRINNRKILAGIAEVVKSIDLMSTIAVAIDKLDKIGEEGVRKELTEQGFSEDELNRLFDIISIKGENSTILTQLKSKLQTSSEGLKGIEELEFILKALTQINQSINLKLDFSLARGLSYYTGCIFEVVSTEGSLKSSIGGGGRYDNLTGIFGLPNVSGVGISFGLDRIYDVIEELKLFPEDLNATSTKVLICAFEAETQLNAVSILKKLRDTQISSELYPELPQSKKEKENPMQKPMNYADALKIPFRLILKENNSMMLKDIKGNIIPVSNVEELIKKLKD